MRIAYICHARYPTEKAHGRQITDVCAAMAKLGHSVTLVTPSMATPITADPFAYYDTPHTFTIERISHADWTQRRFVPGFFRYPLALFAYARALKSTSTLHDYDLLYVRSYHLVSALSAHGVPVVLELHALPSSATRLFMSACKLATKIVCLTSLQRDVLLRWGVETKKILVEADAVDLSRFISVPEKEVAKHAYNLPSDSLVIGYIGGLQAIDMGKGVELVLEAVSQLRREGMACLAWIVGGTEGQQTELRESAKYLGLREGDGVLFKTKVPPAEVSTAMAAADVLVYPAPASSNPYFQRDTSPLKLFEYMAAGRPIVAADLPPLHDVVSAENVFFFEPGSAKDLARAVSVAVHDDTTAQKHVARCRELVQQHTWQKRMGRIIDSMHP